MTACEQDEAPVEDLAPPPVHVAEARLSLIAPTVSGTSELEPLRRATLAAEAPGRVVAIDMERGQRVSAGHVLLRLDVGRTAVATQAAQAGVAQAEAALAQAERERALAERLVEGGSAATRMLDQARDSERLARTALEASAAQARVTRRGLTEAVLRAPFDGTIVTRRVELGEYVAPGTPVATLMDTSELRAEVLLDPRLAIDLAPGAAGTAEVFARPGESFEVEVLRVSEAIDGATRRLPVELVVRDPERRLRPGLAARFRVNVGEPTERLTIESDAVFERFEQTYVYVIDAEGRAERRAIRLGALEDGQQEVLEGLEPGERVVIEGRDRVLDGEMVRVIERGASPEAAPRAAR